MTKTRNLSDLLDANGDVKLGNLDNVPASNDASALTTGTLPIARIADGDIALAKLSATGTKDATTFLRGDNTFAVAGGANTPAFYVTPSADQTSISDNVLTQINFGQENFDTDNAFASNTFTVPSGKGGKYYFNVTLFIETNGAQALNGCEVYFYVNGAQNIYTNTQQNPHTFAGLVHTGVLDLSAGDTVKVYARVDVDNGGTFNVNQDNPANTSRCWWVGYKLI